MTAGGDSNATPAWGAPVMPQEHGAWAMVIAPWLIAAGVTGFSWRQALLLAGVLLAYMALAAALQYPRANARRRTARPLRWAAVYALAALVPLYLTLASHPQVLWIGAAAGLALPVELIFLRLKRERALLNGMVSIAALTTTALLACLVGRGQLDRMAWLIWGLCLVFFLNSLLFVKSMIRKRGQRRSYWVGVLGAASATGAAAYLIGPTLAAGFAPSLLRALLCWGRSLKPAQLGAIEGVSTLIFSVATIVALRGL